MKSCKCFALPVLALALAAVVMVAQLGPSATANVPSTTNVPAVANSTKERSDSGSVTVANWQETGFTGGKGGGGIHKVK